MFFGSSFLGDLSDLMGRRRVLLLCMGGISASFLLMGIGVTTVSTTLLLVGRLLLKKWSAQGVVIWTLTATGASMLISMLFPNESTIWVLTFFTAGLDMVAYTAMMTLFSNAVPPDR